MVNSRVNYCLLEKKGKHVMDRMIKYLLQIWLDVESIQVSSAFRYAKVSCQHAKCRRLTRTFKNIDQWPINIGQYIILTNQ